MRTPRETLEARAALHEHHAEGVTLDDVAAELGCTRERVRQIEAKALAKMRRRLAVLAKVRGSVEHLFIAWRERRA